MRFIVENFGPIKMADIPIKPFTVFIGSNASGKSYLAYLIWCFLAVEPDWNSLRDIISNNLGDTTKDSKELKAAEGVKRCILEIFKRFEEIWGKNLEILLKDTFLVDNISELISTGEDRCKIVICNDDCSMKIECEISEGLEIRVDNAVIKKLEDTLAVSATPIAENIVQVLLRFGEYSHDMIMPMHSPIPEVSGLIPVVFNWIFDGYCPYTPVTIIPDGRSGLLRARDAIVYTLMSAKEGVKLNAVDSNFMRSMETAYPEVRNENIAKISNFIEKRLNIKYTIQRKPPRYIIKFRNIEMPLQKAPSGYRELAPIIYAIRHILDEGQILIVEEPEAHLHPDAQIIVTRALASLSEYNDVIITTHSITVLDEISNLIRLNRLSKEEKAKFGYEEWEGLDFENISIYLFTGDGYVKPLEIFEDGLAESELDRVILEIANLHAQVEEAFDEHTRKLQAQK